MIAVKSTGRRFVERSLKVMAKLALQRYRPEVIAVCGGVGKTTTKEALLHVLSRDCEVRSEPKGYQNALGFSLAALGIESKGFRFIPWMGQSLRAVGHIIYSSNYPQILIAPVAFDRMGTAREVSSLLRPDHLVILNVEQAHLEYFSSAEMVIKEYQTMVSELRPRGVLVINADDPYTRLLKAATRNEVITIGQNEVADYMAEVDESVYVLDAERWLAEGASAKTGLNFKVTYRGTRVPVRLPNLVGYHHVFPAMATLAIASRYGISLEEGASRLINIRPAPGRLVVLRGQKKTVLVDDTFNASELSMLNALEVLGKIRTRKRRVAVLGDVLEAGVYTERAHRRAGEAAAKVADVLYTVGVNSELIGSEYINSGRTKNAWNHFDGIAELEKCLKRDLREKDVVLFKASQGMRLEKVIAGLLEDPSRDLSRLCRQDDVWKSRPAKFA